MKFYNKSSFKRINRKNLIISICIIILILLLIISFSLYIANQNVRDFFDIYLFKKNISSNNFPIWMGTMNSTHSCHRIVCSR